MPPIKVEFDFGPNRHVKNVNVEPGRASSFERVDSELEVTTGIYAVRCNPGDNGGNVSIFSPTATRLIESNEGEPRVRQLPSDAPREIFIIPESGSLEIPDFGTRAGKAVLKITHIPKPTE